LQQGAVAFLLDEKQIHVRDRYAGIIPRNELEGISLLYFSFPLHGKAKSAAEESRDEVIPLNPSG